MLHKCIDLEAETFQYFIVYKNAQIEARFPNLVLEHAGQGREL